MTSPQLGPLFETLVFAEIYKYIHNHEKNLANFSLAHARSATTFERMPELNKTISAANVVGRMVCYFGDGDITGNQIPISGLVNYLSEL